MHSAPMDDPGTLSGPVRVVIADDEPLARDCMRLVLTQASDVEVVAECRDGAEAVNAIRRFRPDVVFLDVQMPGIDGFAVIQRVGAAAMPAVVFVTAYDTHAMHAFDVHALDYVLKPFENARLLDALERARTALHDQRAGALARRLAALVQDWHGLPRAGESACVERFTVRHEDRVRFVAADDVDWIEADGNYAVLHVQQHRHRVRITLQELEARLDARKFFRIHRSTIVNLNRVRELQPWFGGDYIAILHTGAKLRVSRARAPGLLRPTR